MKLTQSLDLMLLTEKRNRTAVLIGFLSREEIYYHKFNNYINYLETIIHLRDKLITIIGKGYDTFLFTYWGGFEEVVTDILKTLETKERPIFRMGVFDSSLCDENPVPEGAFHDIIHPDLEGMGYSRTEIFERVITNCDLVGHYNHQASPFIKDCLLLAQSDGDIRLFDMT